MARVGTRGAGLSKDIALSVKNKLTHLGANVSDDLARLSGKVEDAFAYADGAVSKNIGKHNARVYQSNGGNWDEVASGILGSSGAGRKAAAEFSDDASQALVKHGDEVSQALRETGEQAGKHASAEFGSEASQALAKHGDEVSQALKETGEQAGKHASAEFGGEASEALAKHGDEVNQALKETGEQSGKHASAEFGGESRLGSIQDEHWFDNVNEIITDGSHMDGKLPKPNIVYETGEHHYIYRTDELGRIDRAYAEDLQLKNHEGRLRHDGNTPDKEVGDHAGHIFGDLFGGSPELDNLISQAKDVNLKEYRRLERRWSDVLKSTPPKKVEVDIKINYEGTSRRPTGFEVNYKIDGEEFSKKLPNINGG